MSSDFPAFSQRVAARFQLLAEKQRLLTILAEKQAGALSALTEKELQDRINALGT